MVGGIASTTKHHHTLSQSILTKQEHNIDALKVTICRFTSPFVADCDGTLFNVVTKQIVPDAVKEDMCEQRAIVNKLFDEFVAQRITISAKTSGLQWRNVTWRLCGKTMKMTADNKVLELKDDRNLLARLLLMSKTRKEVNLQKVTIQTVCCSKINICRRW